jgi:hypothetical protein
MVGLIWDGRKSFCNGVYAGKSPVKEMERSCGGSWGERGDLRGWVGRRNEDADVDEVVCVGCED